MNKFLVLKITISNNRQLTGACMRVAEETSIPGWTAIHWIASRLTLKFQPAWSMDQSGLKLMSAQIKLFGEKNTLFMYIIMQL